MGADRGSNGGAARETTNYRVASRSNMQMGTNRLEGKVGKNLDKRMEQLDGAQKQVVKGFH